MVIGALLLLGAPLVMECPESIAKKNFLLVAEVFSVGFIGGDGTNHLPATIFS